MNDKEHKEILKIEGMTCANCALGIKKHLDKKGVKKVHVNFTTNNASFSADNQFSYKDVIDLINEIGYKAKKESNEIEKTGLSSLEKKFFFTLIFTLPLFSHMFLPKVLFLQNILVQFVLCLPVFLVGLLYFGKSAFRSLKSGLPNMDVLILMGSSAAFFYSIYGWILFYGTEQSHDYLFFETTATIITLVLLGNVLEYRSVKQTTTAIQELSAIKLGIAKKEEDGEIKELPFDEIVVNDILIVNEGDKIPVDGAVIWGSALIDESMLTGESVPLNKEVGDNIIGGTILNVGSIKMIATSVGDEMLISQIIELVKNAEDNKPDIQRLGDKVSGVFVPMVLLISILTFFISHYGFGISGTKAFLRAIAVLVISCPCAMGLATPTAVMVGIGRAAKKGILLKGGSTLQKLASVKNMVFDKTGTLTTGNFSIKKIQILKGEEDFVKSIMRDNNYFATFMPKPFDHLPGNGLHIHLSLWDNNNKEISGSENNEFPLSELGSHFVAGILNNAHSLTATGCASINSYKRIVPGSWSPAHICWGNENRSTLVRIPGKGNKRVMDLVSDFVFDDMCEEFFPAIEWMLEDCRQAPLSIFLTLYVCFTIFCKIFTPEYLTESSETKITITPIINNMNLYFSNL